MSRRHNGRTRLLGIAAVMAAVSLHACSGSSTAPGSAGTVRMTLAYENSCTGPVDLKFFDRTNGTIWPDATSSYEIGSLQRRTFTLDCRSAAQVCYGASERANPSHYWGVGLDNTQTCPDCCIACGQTSPPLKVLVCN